MRKSYCCSHPNRTTQTLNFFFFRAESILSRRPPRISLSTTSLKTPVAPEEARRTFRRLRPATRRPPTSARPPRNKTHHEALHYLTRPWSPTARANADSSPSNDPSSGATQLTGNVLHKLQGDVISGLGRVAGESISRCSGLGDEAESQRKLLQNDRPACYRIFSPRFYESSCAK